MAKILSGPLRVVFSGLIDPTARFLVGAGISPNAVTIGGTAGVVAGAVGLGARGHLIPAVVVITLCCLTDMLDGAMARVRGGATRFGGLLDSTMDRIADGAIFGAVVWWTAGTGDRSTLAAALLCLLTGQVVSYVKARAEGLGRTCDVGLAERAERLVLVGIGGLLAGFGVSWGLGAALWLLAVLSGVTVVQRLVHVHRQDQQA